MNKVMSTLFLAQSYHDTWDDFERALNRADYPCWDYIIITASNEQQAEGFRAQLAERENKGVLPSRTHFAVIPDPDGKRVGSGGATLGVIKYVAKHSKTSDFSKLRILVIHSGGDSKRVPQYSALGKLFSPVPHMLPDGRISTLFDEFMIATAGVPSRMREGMLLLSGDVLLLFNPLQIDYSGSGAAAVSFKENVQTGKNHGVFLRGDDGCVERFLHKQSVQSLREHGAVNANDCVDIDTGAVIFSSEMVSSLYSLISGGDDDYNRFVNETVRLSLYGDFLYPLAAKSTLDDFYNEKPEGSFCDELKEARTAVWNVLHQYRMKLLRLAPAKFIHFGTTREIMHLMNDDIEQYSYLDWSRKVGSSAVHENIASYNSIVSSAAKCGSHCYFESSYVHSDAEIGNNVLLSYVDIRNGVIPDNVVLHGLKQKDGTFVVRIYGINDNPKDILEDGGVFLGKPLSVFLENNGIGTDELWKTDSHSLWEADLYPACETIHDAVAAALNIYDMANGGGDVNAWRNLHRMSLQSGFNNADSSALIAWEKRMQELVSMDKLSKYIYSGKPASESVTLIKDGMLTPVQEKWLKDHLSRADFAHAVRLNYYLGAAGKGKYREKYISDCFRCIRDGVMKGSMESLAMNENCRIIKDRHVVNLPLRVNWGGGWSDTPPYCNEHGGTVLNAAILLDGKMPVEVTLTRLDEKKIIFDSRDMDIHGEFTDIESLQETGDPYDPFALQKAALLACGVIPVSGGSLDEILDRLGGGFLMQTEVTDVPKGSGLGTSSILAAACVKAIFEFMGITHNEDDLYSHVLCMEQIMSTGGGWQDQVGGLSTGIKYITSAPGLNQKLRVEHLTIPDFALKELRERFCLIYTGQRRLARNLLRDVVGKYVGNEKESVYALNEIQRYAALMRFELERGHIDDFAKLLNEHWELSKMIDSGSTNTLIDNIFNAVEDMIDGKLVCGAGGGGFLQVILKKGITRDMIHERLKGVFQDNDVDVWDCTII